jgi:hypothetical protein
MKSWILIFLVPLAVLLSLVVFQLQLTRSAMASFAQKHGMTYVKSRVPLFGMGEIRGTVNGAAFFMGMLSMDHAPEADEKDLSYRKYLSMHIEISGMPRKLIIEQRTSGSHVTDTRRSQTVTPPVRTGDADFDSKFCVYGIDKEVLTWLTAGRRRVIADILIRENCVIAKGGLIIPSSETRLTLQDMEEMYSHLSAARKAF